MRILADLNRQVQMRKCTSHSRPTLLLADMKNTFPFDGAA